MTDAILAILTVCGLSVISQLSPGPDVFFVFRTALAQGFRGGAAVALGINAGFFLQSIVACTAGAWVMRQSWSQWLLLAAACWLLYLAWKIFPRNWRQVDDELGIGCKPRESALSLIWQGFLCNILNPKCMLFILGLSVKPISQYGQAYAWFAPALVACLFFASLSGWLTWSALLQLPPLRGCYLRHAKGIDAVFAVLLAVFAVLIVVR